MKNLRWQSTLALAPIFNTPRHMIGYWLIFIGLGLSLLVFQIFEEQINQAEDRSLSELLGGDVRVNVGYRKFDPTELRFLDENSEAMSEQIIYRSMILMNSEELPLARLSNIRAVDQNYPLIGKVDFQPSFSVTDFQNRLGKISGHYGVFFSKDLADYFQIKLNSIVIINDMEFEFRGVVSSTPDFEGNNNAILPSAIISKDAIAHLLVNDDLLLERQMLLNLDPNVTQEDFKTNADLGFHDAGWQITTTTDFAKTQSALVNLAKRLAGLINILVVLSFATALFSVFKTHFVEERATQITLYANGATALQIAIAYILRLLAFTALTMAFIGIFVAALGYIFPGLFVLSLPGIETGLNMPKSIGITSGILLAIGAIVGLLAHWSMHAKSRGWALFLALALIAALIYFIAPLYAINQTVLIILIVFFGSLLGFWILLKFIKWTLRKRVRGSKLHDFALLEYSGRHSAQEYFGTALFANLILVTCFSIAFFAVYSFVDNLRSTPKPTHYIADIQNDQVAPLHDLLGENGATQVTQYPIIRGRVTEVNERVPTNRDHWLFRGDRFFGVDQTGQYNLSEDKDGNFEVAMDEKLASELGLSLGDTLTLAVIGETKTLIIHELRESNFRLDQMDFVFLLPNAVVEDWPHIFVFSMNLTQEQRPVLRKIIDQFPNVIVISSNAAITKLDQISNQLIQALTLLGIHVLGAGLIALICLGILLKRKDRYDQSVFSIMGMRESDMRIIQVIKILINAGIATFVSAILAFIFVRYGLNQLVEINVNISIGAILAIIFISGLAFAMIPSILLLFSRNSGKNAERYIQDYQKLELDF